MMNVKDIQRKH